MGTNHYIALLSKSGNPVSEDARLYLDMLCFLDDRHIPVQVIYADRLPSWTQSHSWWANGLYFFKLLMAPTAVVLVDFNVCAQAGLAIFLARWFRKHRVIVSVFRPQTYAGAWYQRWGLKFRVWACLTMAHRVLVHSDEGADWVRDETPVNSKLRYFASHQSSLGDEALLDTSWWPLNGFKPRWHRRRHFETRMNMRVSIN